MTRELREWELFIHKLFASVDESFYWEVAQLGLAFFGQLSAADIEQELNLGD